MSKLGIGIIGCGGITLQNHLPGIAACPQANVAGLCDASPANLQRAREAAGPVFTTHRYQDLLERDDLQAVIVATPNVLHAEIATAAAKAGKHILCEKPLALNAAEARRMWEAAEQAGVRHMTAFTYRFVPAMRYLAHLVRGGAIGQPYHFRSCRLQDWGDRNLGWRQVAAQAGSGELGDMLSHRIDFAHLLCGPMQRLVADTRRLLDERQGQPSDLEDWVTVLAEFRNQATGVLESSKLATGRSESWRSQDYVEINGSEGSFVFFTERWNELQIGRKNGAGLEKLEVPETFWKAPGSPRDPRAGNPLITFRYDQIHEFVDAIHTGRPCVPSFREGYQAQLVMEATLESARTRRWVDLPAAE